MSQNEWARTRTLENGVKTDETKSRETSADQLRRAGTSRDGCRRAEPRIIERKRASMIAKLGKE